MANLAAPMPSFATPFLKDGLVNEPWYRYLFQLQLRTGGTGGTDFVSEADFQKLVSTVANQDREINGLYPTPVRPADSQDIGFSAFLMPPPDPTDQMIVPVPVGTLAQQNADNVAITGGSIDGTTVGATTASSGAFTTISASSTITPSQTAGIVGTTTNNNANAGSVGEYITATGTNVSLTTATPANITSISLGAGDWEVHGNIQFNPAGTTTIQQVVAGFSSTSATFQASVNFNMQASFTTGAVVGAAIPSQRFSLASTTTIYLVAQSSFGVSTMQATATLRARRPR